MSKLEDKILKKVYWFETKNLISKTVTFIFFAAVAFFFGTTLYNQWVEQQTLDLLQLFQEDSEIIRRYLGEVISTLYEETPKIPLLIFSGAVLLSGFFVLIFVKNFSKIKKKTKSLLKFWQSH